MAARERELTRAAVLGHPIAHSLSPALHRAAYAELGLREWSYEAVDVTEAELPRFVAVNPDTGETRFAVTAEEHAANVELFRQWLRENGG